MVVVGSSGDDLDRHLRDCSPPDTVSQNVLNDILDILNKPSIHPDTPIDEGGANQTSDTAGLNTTNAESSPRNDYNNRIDSCLSEGSGRIDPEELCQKNQNVILDVDDAIIAPEGSRSRQGTTKHDRLKSSDASPRQQGLPKLLPKPTKAMPTSEPPPQKKYLCGLDGCDKTYPRSNGLNRHQRKCHGTSPGKAGRPRNTRR
ncbi:hypothetical protein P168DRAFT_39785 [Aspergillus campestris IBT 28561]|uniref:C2H2-type domain-containing protein n=1 Tax=Aspergillus campestris (strain IBT 28561) TaxID=1392248 RepID=A0A2I1CWJ8_ASPC2|nr:uncharacterized protein P168DRAFT_39785 [Aspergillus campestris IBT 28561]PKY02001.1 hypothetical protein P168DRAFT_39785 [Aspergillus campestris IBT 28561]